ncbi:MAG: hypothetical protein GF308_07110 [Candidatus Heimdallarchaeota archaeon]|nr:hypothetical protein [Candidatus Heimdallarchaeota archaeon]
MLYQYFLSPIIGYFIGSIPFAWILVKLFTKENNQFEDSDIITTQKTIDLAGPIAGLLKGALDITKGFLAAFLIRFVIFPNFTDNFLLTVMAGLGAIIGHSWQIWLKFKGGRAYSVFLGTLIVINPWGLLIWIGCTIIFVLITKYTSLAGMISTVLVAITFTFFYVFSLTNWNEWSIIITGWGYSLLLALKLIPRFIKLARGELPKGK